MQTPPRRRYVSEEGGGLRSGPAPASPGSPGAPVFAPGSFIPASAAGTGHLRPFPFALPERGAVHGAASPSVRPSFRLSVHRSVRPPASPPPGSSPEVPCPSVRPLSGSSGRVRWVSAAPLPSQEAPVQAPCEGRWCIFPRSPAEAAVGAPWWRTPASFPRVPSTRGHARVRGVGRCRGRAPGWSPGAVTPLWLRGRLLCVRTFPFVARRSRWMRTRRCRASLGGTD